jgi:hypothetical protein
MAVESRNFPPTCTNKQEYFTSFVLVTTMEAREKEKEKQKEKEKEKLL